MVPVPTAMVVAGATIRQAAVCTPGVNGRLHSSLGIHQPAKAPDHKEQRQHQRDPHCATQTNETRAAGLPDPSSIAFATRGPAASQAAWLAKLADPIALTSPGWMKNQSTSVHMGAS